MLSFKRALPLAFGLCLLAGSGHAQDSLSGWWRMPPVASDPTLEAAASALTPVGTQDLLLCWSAYRAGQYDLFQRLGTPGQFQWPAIAALASSAGHEIYPACVANGEDLYAAWVERSLYSGQGRILFARYQAGAWSTPRQLVGYHAQTTELNLAAAGNNLMLAWADARTGTPNVYTITSSDQGGTWTAVRTVSPVATRNAYPSLVAGGSGFAVVWEEWSSGRGEVAFSQTADLGQTWSSPLRLSADDKLASERPRLCAAGSILTAAWQEEQPSGRYAIQVNVRAAAGTWSGQRLTATDIDARQPRLAAADERVWLTYQSPVAGGGDADTPWLLASADRGQTWSSAAHLAVSATAGGRMAQPAAASGEAYLAWLDNASTRPALRFTMNPPPYSAVPPSHWLPLR